MTIGKTLELPVLSSASALMGWIHHGSISSIRVGINTIPTPLPPIQSHDLDLPITCTDTPANRGKARCARPLSICAMPASSRQPNSLRRSWAINASTVASPWPRWWSEPAGHKPLRVKTDRAGRAAATQPPWSTVTSNNCHTRGSATRASTQPAPPGTKTSRGGPLATAWSSNWSGETARPWPPAISPANRPTRATEHPPARSPLKTCATTTSSYPGAISTTTRRGVPLLGRFGLATRPGARGNIGAHQVAPPSCRIRPHPLGAGTPWCAPPPPLALTLAHCGSARLAIVCEVVRCARQPLVVQS